MREGSFGVGFAKMGVELLEDAVLLLLPSYCLVLRAFWLLEVAHLDLVIDNYLDWFLFLADLATSKFYTLFVRSVFFFFVVTEAHWLSGPTGLLAIEVPLYYLYFFDVCHNGVFVGEVLLSLSNDVLSLPHENILYGGYIVLFLFVACPFRKLFCLFYCLFYVFFRWEFLYKNFYEGSFEVIAL